MAGFSWSIFFPIDMRFFYGQNIEQGYINVLFNYVIVMRYNTSLKVYIMVINSLRILLLFRQFVSWKLFDVSEKVLSQC